MSKRVLMRVNAMVRRSVFHRRAFVRLVFRTEVAADPGVQSYCEWNSILFRAILGLYLRPGMRVLDMGTGAHALLALCAKRICPDATVVASDIVPQRVELARLTAQRNRLELDCRLANLFDGVGGRFDLILFAPPIIPSDELKDLGFDLQEVPGLGVRRCWSSDGGRDGLEVLLPFLQQLPQRLREAGLALVTLNPSHFPRQRFQQLCHDSGLEIRRIHRWLGIVEAYALERSAGCHGHGEAGGGS